MTAVIPGIHLLKLPGPFPNTDSADVNCYLIEGEDGWLLVDTGWGTDRAFAALERQLGELGVGFEDIGRILITHFHPDHYGLAGKLKGLSGASVALHQIEKDFIDARYVSMDNLLGEMSGWLRLHGAPEEELPSLRGASLGVRQYVSPVLPEIVLQGGETITQGRFEFEVVWTPGHSPGHVCLYERERRVLLSGDHLLPTIFPNVGLHPQSGKEPLKNFLDSLRTVEQLDVDLVLPAHEHAFTNARQRAKEILQHHRDRKAAIIDVLKQGAQTAYDVSFRIPWIVNGVTMSFEELLPLDKRLAVMSALAHLEPLCQERIAEKSAQGGILFYSVVRES
jgi:glyoxylase-like metal-dependent hydrolase (beta-lactamase superfamily II)